MDKIRGRVEQEKFEMNTERAAGLPPMLAAADADSNIDINIDDSDGQTDFSSMMTLETNEFSSMVTPETNEDIQVHSSHPWRHPWRHGEMITMTSNSMTSASTSFSQDTKVTPVVSLVLEKESERRSIVNPPMRSVTHHEFNTGINRLDQENKTRTRNDERRKSENLQPILLVAPEFHGGVHRIQRLHLPEDTAEVDQPEIVESPESLLSLSQPKIRSPSPPSPPVPSILQKPPTPPAPRSPTASLKSQQKRNEIQNLAELRKFALIKLKARRWMKLSGVGDQQHERNAAVVQQNKRPQIEIPRALKLDIWKEAHPIVQKIHENYKLSLGEEDDLTERTKCHLETHANKFNPLS